MEDLLNLIELMWQLWATALVGSAICFLFDEIRYEFNGI